MNDIEANKRLAESAATLMDFITKSAEAVGTAAGDGAASAWSFTKEQVPLLIREIVVYHAAYHLIWIAILTLTSVALWKTSSRCFASAKEACSERRWGAEESLTITGIFARIASITAIAFIPCNLLSLAKITLAPRLFLAEFLISMAKR